MDKTVKDLLDECTADINRLKVAGGATLLVVKILERLVIVVKTIALHTAAAKIKD